MKKTIVGIIIGFFLGAIVFGVAMYFAIMPSIMIMEDQIDLTFDNAVTTLEAKVDEIGWKIPKVHDFQATMEKFGYEVLPVKVFELCHPDHAYRILNEGDERIVSSLMPCRVAIYEKPDGNVYVSRMNTSLMAGMLGGLVAEVMAQASSETEVILKSVLPAE